MKTTDLLRKKLTKVTIGASAAATVLEEYADKTTVKRRKTGNERLRADRKYLRSISK